MKFVNQPKFYLFFMRKISLLFSFFFTLCAFAQDDYKGYYITESGEKVNGFFEFYDFFKTEKLKFKKSGSGEFSPLPKDVVEYGIDEGKQKFEKHIVETDMLGDKTYSKDPQLSSQALFLNVLVKGKASLYSYTKDYNTFFFLSNTSIKQGAVEQLINRKYLLPEGKTVDSPTYRRQLYNLVKCEGQQVSDFIAITYDKDAIVGVVKKYNECSGSKSEIFSLNSRKEFAYSFFAGVHYANMGISYYTPAVADESSLTFSAGAEAAYIFPNESWELYARGEFEPLNYELVDSKDQGYNVLESTFKMSGYAFNFSFGPRYKYILSNRSNIFLECGFGVYQPIGGELEWYTTLYPLNDGIPYRGDNGKYNLATSFALNFGVGYTFNKNYSVAVKYITNRDYMEDVDGSFNTKVERLGLVFSYRL